ncbi:MAG: acyl carrier protein [Ruminococcaceae bacterium]|nr:acyl carrier protein [Oscillospiraceae bacterium]
MPYEKIKQIICEEFEIDEDDISLDTDLVADLGFDELDIADLCMSLEDAFEKEISDEDLQEIETVGDFVKHLE